MFKINYNIITASFENIESMTDEELRYNFLLGSVIFNTACDKIEMEWEWIPLLDFSYSLSEISKKLAQKESPRICFEFTESAETLEFIREGINLKIIPSFTSTIMNVFFDDYNEEVKNFHKKISDYIKVNIDNKINNNHLNKYMVR